MHFSTGKGQCKDTDLVDCDGDAETLKWLADALDAEKPDLVVSWLILHVSRFYMGHG